MSVSKESIFALASQFRCAIERALGEDEIAKDAVFKNFPRGCCGDSSELLAQFLLDKGVKTYYVCGMHNENKQKRLQSHAWLRTDDGMIVDITADQFKNDPEYLNYDLPVYVGMGDCFHDLFTIEERNVRLTNGIDVLNSYCAIRLKRIYSAVVEYID